jgi:hypothetical protein
MPKERALRPVRPSSTRGALFAERGFRWCVGREVAAEPGIRLPRHLLLSRQADAVEAVIARRTDVLNERRHTALAK